MLLIFTRAVYGRIMASFHRHFLIEIRSLPGHLADQLLDVYVFWSQAMAFGEPR